jgi:hypothetical protein
MSQRRHQKGIQKNTLRETNENTAHPKLGSIKSSSKRKKL